jgi:acyl carrier protein
MLLSMPIGKTVANNSLFILDKSLNPVPLMVTGELYIAGEGVSRGYLNNPELTADKFIPTHHSSFITHHSDLLYKTGDQARWLPDGTVEFLGRADTQVKIRGFRIEPGEIESMVSRFPGITDVIVMALEVVPGEAQLVAYVVPSGEDEALSISELRDFLHNHLPDYMVPSAFVEMEILPLNPNGKVDRKALPKPGKENLDMGHEFVAPRTPTEETIAAILSEVLSVDTIGVYDNFFNLGGHSLIATRVVSRLQKTFQVQISLQDFFRNPNAADLAKEIDMILWAAKESSVSSTDEEDQEDLLL